MYTSAIFSQYKLLQYVHAIINVAQILQLNFNRGVFHQIKFKRKNIGAPERRNEASEWRTSDVAFPHGRLKAGRIMHLNDTLDQSP